MFSSCFLNLVVLKLIRIQGNSPLSISTQKTFYLNEVWGLFFFFSKGAWGVAPGFCWDTVKIGGCFLGLLVKAFCHSDALPASSGSLHIIVSFGGIFSVQFLCTVFLVWILGRFSNRGIFGKMLPTQTSQQDTSAAQLAVARYPRHRVCKRWAWGRKNVTLSDSRQSAEVVISFTRVFYLSQVKLFSWKDL